MYNFEISQRKIYPSNERKKKRARKNIVSDLSGNGTERTSKKPLVNKSNKNTVKKKNHQKPKCKRAKTIKLLEENRGKASRHRICKDFLDITPKEHNKGKNK